MRWFRGTRQIDLTDSILDEDCPAAEHVGYMSLGVGVLLSRWSGMR
jgi:hypothetical protein